MNTIRYFLQLGIVILVVYPMVKFATWAFGQERMFIWRNKLETGDARERRLARENKHRRHYAPGHMYGPRVPSVGFWYYDEFLGEALLPDGDIQKARASVRESLQMFGGIRDGRLARIMSMNCTYKIYY